MNRTLLALVAISAVAFAAYAFVNRPMAQPAHLAKVAMWSDRLAARQHWPGMALAVVEPGQVVWTHTSGFADVPTQIPFTTQTVMPIGSISKVFIGATAAELIRQGRFDPETRVGEVWPDLPDPYRNVTFSQLATHTAGILDSPNAYDEAAYALNTRQHPEDLGTFLRNYLHPDGAQYDAAHWSDTAPGSTYAYSNVGAALAAEMLALSTSTPFDELSQKLILDPVGMTQSTWWQNEVPTANRASLHDGENGFAVLQPYALATWPDGGLNASVSDLARFLAVVMGDGRLAGQDVIPAETVKLLTKPRAANLPGMEATHDVGLFWTRETLDFIFWELSGEGHNGGDPGVLTFMYKFPDRDLGIVVMMNGVPDSTWSLIQLARLLTFLANTPE